MDAIFKRRSIRKFTDDEVEQDKIEKILRAGMAAPSAGNSQEWVFIVIKNQETKNKIMEIHKNSGVLKTAPVAILVCADKEKETYMGQGWWVQDCSAAMENMIIEATFLELGSIWVGIYPIDERVEVVKTLMQLPSNIMPLGIVALGTPQKEKEPIDRYLSDRVYYEKYQSK